MNEAAKKAIKKNLEKNRENALENVQHYGNQLNKGNDSHIEMTIDTIRNNIMKALEEMKKLVIQGRIKKDLRISEKELREAKRQLRTIQENMTLVLEKYLPGLKKAAIKGEVSESKEILETLIRETNEVFDRAYYGPKNVFLENRDREEALYYYICEGCGHLSKKKFYCCPICGEDYNKTLDPSELEKKEVTKVKETEDGYEEIHGEKEIEENEVEVLLKE